MKTILAPIDFSPVTLAVAEEAIRLARMVKGRVVFVHVIEPPSQARDIFPAGKLSVEVLRAAKQMVQEKLDELDRKLRRRYAQIELVQVTGKRVDCLVDQARKLPATYVVIGSHGHGAMFDAIVGSVARGVLLRAPCPVLVVPAKAPKA